MSFDLAQLGAWVESDPFTVSAADIIAYAKATNDTEPRHLEGDIAPPLFAVRYPVSRTMKRANDLVTSAFVLHGEHDIHFRRPITPGMRLRCRARVVGVHQRPSGVAITIHCETASTDGDELVNEHYETTFAHRQVVGESRGSPAPEHRWSASAGPQTTLSYPMTDDQTRRYAEASLDRSPYTFDHDAARQLGLPGAIAHGLLTMAFCARAVVAAHAPGHSERLARIAVRFSGLLRVEPGQAVTTRLWPSEVVDGHREVKFDAVDSDGKEIIRHGLAALRD